MTDIERIINGNLITNTKNIHDITPEEQAAVKDGINSAISIEIGNTFITGGTLAERCALTGENPIETRIKPGDIRDEEDVEMYILEDCVLIVGYTICAILDINPWDGVDFPCRLIHDLRG